MFKILYVDLITFNIPQMNVAIFTDTFLPKIDGIAISINQFCKILGGRGHRFQIFCPEYESGNFFNIEDHTEVLRFSNFGLPSYPDVKAVLPNPNKIRKAMNSFKPDLIHIHTPGILGQYAISLAVMFRIPLIGTYHTLVSEQHMYVNPYRLFKIDKLLGFLIKERKVKKSDISKITRKKQRSISKQVILNIVNTVYERCDLLISPSHLIKKTLIEENVRAPIKVVSNGIDLSKYQQEAKTDINETPRLIHTGRISFEKNVDVLLKAFTLILEKIPNATLDIVGDGPALHSLKVEAEQLGIANQVKFHGFVPHDTLVKIYKEYDLFLTASTMETQGLVVLEAITCGLPCVGTDAFALPELIQHGKNGYLAAPFDHIETANRAVEILQDKNKYLEFSKAGLEIAKSHNVFGCADEMQKAYEYTLALKS